MKTNINNIYDLELYLRTEIQQTIEQSLNKNTEYQNIDFLRDIFKYEYNEFSNFIKEELFYYTLKLLITEITLIYDSKGDGFVDIKESIASKLIDDDEKIDDDIDKKTSDIKSIINSHYSYSSREIDSNKSLSNKYKQLSTKSNLVEYHLSSDKNTLQKLDILSYAYLIEDLNTYFNEHFFINDLSFLYKVANKNKYLLSFEDYLSYLSNTLAKENNIFNHCINLRDTILIRDSKKTKNYFRILKSIESKYNEYIKDINLMIKNKDSNYDKELLTVLFDNFLFNNFFSSLDNNIFDYLSKEIDLMYIFDKQKCQSINKSYDIIKSQNILFNINFLKLMMLYNINLHQLIDKASSLEFIIFRDDINLTINSTRFGYTSRIFLEQFLLVIFDIFWDYYISVGEILNTIIHVETENDMAYLDELIKFTYKLLCNKNYHCRSYSEINLTKLTDTKYRKSQCLLISYLFLSTIHQKAFYNLHFE